MNITENAIRQVIVGMRTLRPNLSEVRIRQVISECLEGKYEPIAETTQDIWEGFKRALEKQ